MLGTFSIVPRYDFVRTLWSISFNKWSGQQVLLAWYVARLLMILLGILIVLGSKVSDLGATGSIITLVATNLWFEQVTIDLITYLHCTRHGFESVCTFVIFLSKYTYFVPCRESSFAPELSFFCLMPFIIMRYCLF